MSRPHESGDNRDQHGGRTMAGAAAEAKSANRWPAVLIRGAALALGIVAVLVVDWRWTMLAVATGLNILYRDRFPFSNFPMYARFSPGSFTLRVEDGAGTILPLRPTFGMTAGGLKGFYRRQIRSTDPAAAERAAEATIEFLLAARARVPSGSNGGGAPREGIRLVRTDLLMQEGAVGRVETVIAERPEPAR
jgi:hypothetical protein